MKIDQRLHEMLCAYALGEADAAQKADVERELLANPELRHELEKIEETIGLVRETLGESETMSKEAEKALMSAVSPEPQRSSWHASGWMRMAAGFLVVGGSVMLMRSMYENNTVRMSPDRVAKLEEREMRAAKPIVSNDFSSTAEQDKELLAQLGTDRDPGGFGMEAKVKIDVQAPPPADQAEIVAFEEDRLVNTVAPPEVMDRMSIPHSAEGMSDQPSNPNVMLQGAGLSTPVVPGDARVAGSVDVNNFSIAKDSTLTTFDAKKGTYRGAGDTAPDLSRTQATPKGEDGSGAFSQPGLGGGGGHTGYKVTGPASTGPSSGSPSSPASPTPALSTASAGADRLRSLGYMEEKTKEQLSLGQNKDAGRVALDDKATAGKAKSDELAKKAAPGQTPNEKSPFAPPGFDVFTAGSGGSAGSLALHRQEPRSPADEAQVRLRQLLERADSAGDERLARLKDGVESQDVQKLRGLGYISGEDRDNEISLRELYFKLTPEQRAQILDQECRRVFDGCRRLPNERPRDMFFRYWGDNPFEITALDALSTFSADVDTASYALARRYLVEGKLPEKAQIRTEEFVNYFKADVAAPTHGTFAIHTDLAPTRFAQPANSTWTLRVVVRGQELAKEERKPLHLTCVIDCSGSMNEQNRMETVKDTLRLLLTQLNSADMVGIVAFSTEARQILPLTSVANRGLIEVAIGQLAPDGWTNSEAGLKLGYETALAGLDAHSTNRVIFLSDGVANQGETDPAKLSDTLKPIRERGVYLNTIGVGMNNHNDALLEQLADKGDGMCSYVDDMREAKRVMMDNFMGSVETIARDVKIQVEFDPAQVTKYRLLGYENRAIADADFRNDKVDAGEVGSGHQVTALYEIERNLAVSGEKPLATVRLRYKAPRIVNGPANEEAREIAQEVRGSQQTSFEGADAGYRRAVIVGQFAEFLRRSVNARGRSIDELLAEAHKLELQIPQDADFHEFVALAERSKQLVLANLPNCDELCQAIDAYRTWQFQCAQAERLSHDRQQQIVDDLARRNREMEEQIRELLRRRLESSPR